MLHILLQYLDIFELKVHFLVYRIVAIRRREESQNKLCFLNQTCNRLLVRYLVFQPSIESLRNKL